MGYPMQSTRNIHIEKALETAQLLIMLADEGEAVSRDDGCLLLYGVIRDCAYRIRQQAEREKDFHELKGCWL